MPRRRPWIVIAILIAAAATLLYRYPLFHVVPLDQASPRAGDKAMDPVVFIDQFWRERLIPGAAQAVDAVELLTAIQQDRKSARQAFGHSVGVGGGYYFFVAGTGRIMAVEKDTVRLSLRDGEALMEVALASGKLFGNAVRDGTGLLSVSDFPNSQDFNALSSELNRRIELQVLPILQKNSRVGAVIRFVGCAEVTDEAMDLHPLRIVPFIVELP